MWLGSIGTALSECVNLSVGAWPERADTALLCTAE